MPMARKNKFESKADEPATKAEVSQLNRLMYALVVVLFVGFAGMFVATGSMMLDSLTNDRQSMTDLRDTVRDQNDKIDALTSEIKSLKSGQTSNQ
jgi:cell division protein FtsL